MSLYDREDDQALNHLQRHNETFKRIDREKRLIRAVLKRISEQGDMNIRIRGETFHMILCRTGLSWDTIDRACYREVDAVALEALIVLGDQP